MATPVPITTMCSASDTSGSITYGVWTQLCSIPTGYGAFPAGRRILCLFSVSYAAYPAAQRAMFKIDYAGVDVPYTQAEMNSQSLGGDYGRLFIMAIIVSNGASDIHLAVSKAVNNTYGTYAQMRCTVLDLDADNVRFPPQSEEGWKWVENTTSINPSVAGDDHSTLSFVADGTSAYLAIATATFSGCAANGGYSILELKSSYDTDWPLHKRPGGDAGWVHMLNAARVFSGLTKGTAVTLAARVSDPSNNWSAVTCSRILLLRLSTFEISTFHYTGNSVYIPGGTAWNQVGTTKNVTQASTEYLMVFRRTEVWAAASDGANDRTLRDGATAENDVGRIVYSGINNTDAWEPTMTVDAIQRAAGSYTYAQQVKDFNGGGCKFNRSMQVVLRMRAIHPAWQNVSAGSDLVTGASAVPSVKVRAAAAASMVIDGAAHNVRVLSVAGSADTLFSGNAMASVPTNAAAYATVLFAGKAHALIAVDQIIPSVATSLFSSDIPVNDKANAAVSGDDHAPRYNRLMVGSQHELVIDPAYTGTAYTFETLGLKPGDRLLLVPADGEDPLVGANRNKELTIMTPSALEVMEILTYPDDKPIVGTPVPYKFFATKRGL